MILAVMQDPKQKERALIAVKVTNNNERSLGIILAWRADYWRPLNTRLFHVFAPYPEWIPIGQKDTSWFGKVVGVYDTTNPRHIEEMNELLGRGLANLSFASA